MLKDGVCGQNKVMDRNKYGIQELDGALRERFLRLMESESLADCIMVKARVEHGIRSVDILRTGLAVPLEGEKDVRCSDGEWVLRPGLLNVMCAGTRMDVVSRPDPATGRYLTLLVPLCEEVLAAARLLWGTPVAGSAAGPMLRCVAVKDFSGEMEAWSEALLRDDHAGARVALVSLVIGLARQGMTRLLFPPAETLAQRIRRHVMDAPDRDWQSRDLEALLGMSGATLRRHLAAEDTSLRELLIDVRMGIALNLLYGTQLPLKTVAARVGYRSPDGFVRAFRARYGLEPSQLGRDDA